MSSLEKAAFSTSDAHDPLQGNSHLGVLFYYINLNSLIQAQTQIFTQNESDGFLLFLCSLSLGTLRQNQWFP